MYECLIKDYKKLSALRSFDKGYYIFSITLISLTIFLHFAFGIDKTFLLFASTIILILYVFYMFFKYASKAQNLNVKKLNLKQAFLNLRQHINEEEEEAFLKFLLDYHIDTKDKIKLIINHYDSCLNNGQSFFYKVFNLTNAISMFFLAILDSYINDKVTFVIFVYFLVFCICVFKHYTITILFGVGAEKRLVNNLTLIYCEFDKYSKKMKRIKNKEIKIGEC